MPPRKPKEIVELVEDEKIEVPRKDTLIPDPSAPAPESVAPPLKGRGRPKKIAVQPANKSEPKKIGHPVAKGETRVIDIINKNNKPVEKMSLIVEFAV